MPAPNAAERVLYALTRAAGPDGSVAVSKAALARELCVTSTTVHDAIARLIAAGRVQRQPQLAPDGSLLPNRYIVADRG